MRELTNREVYQVSGGLAPWAGPVLAGFAEGGVSWREVAARATLTDFAGAAGGMATANRFFLSGVKVIRTSGFRGISVFTPTSGGNTIDSEAQELDVAK